MGCKVGMRKHQLEAITSRLEAIATRKSAGTASLTLPHQEAPWGLL